VGARRSAVGLALVALFVSIGLFGAASARSASPSVTFTLSCTPPVVTPGDQWGCNGTIRNDGPQTATHLTMVEEIAGAMLESSTFSVPATCADLVDGGASCDFGNLSAESEITFTTIFATPTSVSGVLENQAYVSFDEGTNDQDQGKQDTRCANTGTPLPCSSLESTELVPAAESLDLAGGYVAYSGADTLGTPNSLNATQNVSTNAQIPYREQEFPNGFGATIVERGPDFAGEACGTGFTCFGQIAEESFVGDFLTSNPLVLSFQLIVPKGKNKRNLLVFHQGEGPLKLCSVAPLTVTGDVCISSIDQDKKTKVMTVVVLSTENGKWGFG